MRFWVPVAVLALISSAAGDCSTGDVTTTSIACQVAQEIWSAGTASAASENDYMIQNSLCNSPGKDDLDWTTALVGCAECVETRYNLSRHVLYNAVDKTLWQDASEVPMGYCLQSYEKNGTGISGFAKLVQAGAAMSKSAGVDVLFFKITKI